MKSLIDFIVDLQQILKETNDPDMKMQLDTAKNDLRTRIKELTQDGYALPQLYAKYGANILKAQIIDANQKIQQANQEGEYRVADLLDEDKIQQRLAPDFQDARQELTAAMRNLGFNTKDIPTDLLERLRKVTGSEDLDQLARRIQRASTVQENRLGQIEDLKEEQQLSREAAIKKRVNEDIRKKRTADLAQALLEKKQLEALPGSESLAIDEDQEKEYKKRIIAASGVPLPDEEEKKAEAEADEPEPVAQKVAQTLAAESPGTIRMRPRATSSVAEPKSAFKIEEEKKAVVDEEEEDDPEISGNLAKLLEEQTTTSAVEFKQQADTLTSEQKKLFITKQLEASDPKLLEKLKRVKKSGAISASKQSRTENIATIQAAINSTKDEDQKQLLREVLAQYQSIDTKKKTGKA